MDKYYIETQRLNLRLLSTSDIDNVLALKT